MLQRTDINLTKDKFMNIEIKRHIAMFRVVKSKKYINKERIAAAYAKCLLIFTFELQTFKRKLEAFVSCILDEVVVSNAI